MLSVFSLLVILFFSILITRIATVVLTHTGLSRQSARFQARSAFTGVGFTTTESENLVNHPVRRRVLMWLMLLGNVGIVSSMSTLIITFVGREGSIWLNVALLAAGVSALWGLAASPWVDRHLYNLISAALKRYTRLEIQDYAGLLHLAGEYQINELAIREHDWLADRDLKDCDLKEEGIAVLGITRKDGTYVGAPDGDTTILAGDTLLLYGRATALENLDTRRKGMGGEMEHEEAVEDQQRLAERERRKDPARRPGDRGPADESRES
jgi:hypothetical protein